MCFLHFVDKVLLSKLKHCFVLFADVYCSFTHHALLSFRHLRKKGKNEELKFYINTYIEFTSLVAETAFSTSCPFMQLS